MPFLHVVNTVTINPLSTVQGLLQPLHPAVGGTDRHLPDAACIQPQILYTVEVLSRKKRLKQPMQVTTSIMDIPMKKEAALNAPEGIAENSVKLPWQASSLESPSPTQ